MVKSVSSSRRAGSFIQPISIDGLVIRATDSVRDLGVILQADMSTNNQVNAVVRGCYYTIK